MVFYLRFLKISFKNHYYISTRRNRIKSKRIKDKDDFVIQAQQKYDKKYDYSRVVFKSGKEHVEIICQKHGIYMQRPLYHLYGRECPKCGFEKRTLDLTMTTTLFVEKAIKVHGLLYDYSKVEYGKSNKDKLQLTCRVHGNFLQSANEHLTGRGCPQCTKKSKGELRIQKFLEEKKIKYKRQQKFTSCKDRRLLPFDFVVECHGAKAIEFHGIQHYELIPYFHKTIKHFTDVQKRDQIKFNWCQKNKIPLLVIPYWEIEKTEEFLEQFLN